MSLYFTRKGADRITRERAELTEKLRATQAQKGEAAEVGGNQWHDNFSFEQLSRDEQMLNAQIATLNQKIRDMYVIDAPPADTSKLRIGHLAVFNVEGESKEYLIGGYEDSEPDAAPPVVSYLAPLVRRFIGKEEGHTEQIELGGQLKTVTLEEIRRPEPGG